MKRARAEPRGIVLVVMGGILVLLLELAVVLLGMAAAHGAVSSVWVSDAAARIAAASGMEYAAARLVQDARPRHSISSEGRGEDWSWRDGPWVRTLDARNPSYAHGEPWQDVSAVRDGIDNDADWAAGGGLDEAGEADRIFVPGEPFADLDGDGARTAWSGRIRGGGGPAASRFLLHIDSPEGRIPLRLLDRCPPENLFVNFKFAPEQAGIVQALDSLGVALKDGAGNPLIRTRRWAIPATGTPVERSWLGKDLATGGPSAPGWNEVEQTLLSFAYAREEIDALRPFLDDRRPVWRGDSLRGHSMHSPICFWTAPREVLASAWMYVGAPNPATTAPVSDFCGEPAGWALSCPRSGLPFSKVRILIWPDEAEALAEAALAYRQSPSCGWEGFRRFLAAHADRIFRADYACLAGPAPAFAWSWAQSKASLAWNAISIDPYPWRGAVYPLAAWATGGVDGNPSASGIQAPPVVGLDQIRWLPTPAAWDPGDPEPYKPVDQPYRTMSQEGSDRIIPPAFTFAPPTRFSIESAAGSSPAHFAARGDLEPLECLELSSQEDFEAWEGSVLAPRGIERLDAPAAPVRLDGAAGFSPGAVTLPFWNWRGIRLQQIDPVFHTCVFAFSRMYGAVSPGGREQGHSAALYWRMSQDFDGIENIPASPASWSDAGIPPWGEMWAIRDPSWIPVRYPGAAPPSPVPPYRIQPDYISSNRIDAPMVSDACLLPHAASGEAWSGPGDRTVHLPGFTPALSNELYPPTTQPPPANRFAILKGFGLSAQLGPASSIELFWGAAPYRIRLETQRGWEGSPQATGTRFTLRVRWVTGELRQNLHPATGALVSTELKLVYPTPSQERSASWFIPDDACRGRWSFPVALAMERLDWTDPRVAAWLADPSIPSALKSWRWIGFISRFTLRVRGEEIGHLDYFDPGSAVPALPAAPWPAKSSGGMIAPQWDSLRLQVRGVDELRLSEGGGLASGDARFRSAATFLSPLYRLDRDATFRQIQWHGIVPPGFPSDAIRVSLIGYDEAGSPLPEVLETAEGDRVHDASPPATPPRIRAFRYIVRFGCGAAVADDCPVFESIWLTFRRRGGLWESWQEKG